MKRRVNGGLLATAAMLLVAHDCWAGGLYLYEIGSPDVGLAAAGYAARAQDASTAFSNPAGMTRLDRPAVMAGAQPMYLHLDFDDDGNTSAVAATLPGGGSATDGDSNSWLPAGGLFYVHPVNDQLRLGFSMAGTFGLSLDYQDDWVGRYYLQEATLQAMSFQPAAAWQLNEQWSVGAGIGILYGILDEEIAVNNVAPSLSDGKLKLDDEELGVQFNLGVLFEPKEGTRFGLTYLSAADLDFSDVPEFDNLGPGLTAILGNRGLLDASLDIGITLPQSVMLSAYHECTDRLALLANVGWQDWSEFGKVDVSVDSNNPTSLTTDFDFDDTWHLALGAQYRLSPPWMLSAGIAYDSNMLDEKDVTPALPVGETWRFGFGALYEWSANLTLGASYELAWVGDLDMDVERGPLAGRVSGSYDATAIQALSLNLEYRF